jgi:biotin carboxylase
VSALPLWGRERSRPVVAVGYGPRCVPVMQLAGAAAGVCDLVWLVDGRLGEMKEMFDLLNRFGAVVDVGGLSVTEAATAVGVHRPEGLVSFLDAGMPLLADVSARLGLLFHSRETAVALTDKFRQREVLAGAGVEGPACFLVGAGPADVVVGAVAGELSWPAILKPRSAQGSRWTFLVSGPEEAVRLLEGLGPDRVEMVLEDYLAGDPNRDSAPFADYVSVESLLAGGVVSHVAVTGRFPLAENFRETGFFIPAVVGDGELEGVLEVVSAAIEALGVTVGCLHTEVKFTPWGPRLIEVNGRVGGGVPEMLERAAGIPLLEWCLRVALGEVIRVDGPVACERVGYRFFLQPPAVSATVRSIDGVDAVSDHPGVDSVSVHRGPGAALDWRDGTRTHILAVVGSAADHEELLAVERLLQREISVTYSQVTG